MNDFIENTEGFNKLIEGYFKELKIERIEYDYSIPNENIRTIIILFEKIENKSKLQDKLNKFCKEIENDTIIDYTCRFFYGRIRILTYTINDFLLDKLTGNLIKRN
jgi:hypothetical protein